MVRDASGHPVRGAAVALVAVDESVLALAGYDYPDPLAVFYPSRGGGVQDFETRLRIALMRPDTARFQLRARNQEAHEARSSRMVSASATAGARGTLRAGLPPPR